MNTETGQIYEGIEQIADAQSRGEPLAIVSARVAKTMRAGQRALEKAKTKRRRKQAKQDRKRNRQRR